MEQVTIIVPFYNVEAYFDECLKSLIKQTHEKLEILCIDDCGTDNSLSIAESWASSDDRIKIIKHKKNKGLGGARNTGIKHANSDYITFVDSDDYVSELFVELLYAAVNKNKSDIAICGIWKDAEGTINPHGATRENNTCLVAENKSNTVQIARRFNPGCSNKIFKHDLLAKNNIRQPENSYYEDVVFWLMTVYYSHKITTIPDRLYYYRQRPNSIIHTLSYKHIDDRFKFIRGLDGFVKNHIMRTPNTDIQKIANDTLMYFLVHLHYGEALIINSSIDNKKNMEEYYANEIRKFSVDCNWPSLPEAYKHYQENNALPEK